MFQSDTQVQKGLFLNKNNHLQVMMVWRTASFPCDPLKNRRWFSASCSCSCSSLKNRRV